MNNVERENWFNVESFLDHVIVLLEDLGRLIRNFVHVRDQNLFVPYSRLYRTLQHEY